MHGGVISYSCTDSSFNGDDSAASRMHTAEVSKPVVNRHLYLTFFNLKKRLHARWSYHRRLGYLLLCACSTCDVNCLSSIASHCLLILKEKEFALTSRLPEMTAASRMHTAEVSKNCSAQALDFLVNYKFVVLMELTPLPPECSLQR